MGIPALTEEQAKARVVELLCDGLRLVDVARVGNMPSLGRIMRMRRADPEFDADVRAAMQVRALAQAEEIVELADRAGEHVLQEEYFDDWGDRRTRRVTVIDGDRLKRDQMRIATRQWMAERLMPKVFGLRTAHEHTGSDGGAVRLLIGPTAEAYEASRGTAPELPKD